MTRKEEMKKLLRMNLI